MNLMFAKYFPAAHPRAGEPTEFPDNILAGIKKHTVRDNYPFWLPHNGKRVNLCVWDIEPYRSQVWPFASAVLRVDLIVQVEKDQRGEPFTLLSDKCGDYKSIWKIDDFSRDDGLSESDFTAWFGDLYALKGKACIWLDDVKEVCL